MCLALQLLEDGDERVGKQAAGLWWLRQMDTGMRGLVQTRRRSVCGGEAPDALDLSVSKVMGVAGRGLSGVPSMKMTSMSTRNAVFPGRDSHLHGASPLSAHWPAVSPMQSPQSRRDRLRHGGKNGFQASPRQFNVAERELEGQVHGTSLIKLPAGVSAMSNGLLDGADAFKHKPGTRWPERGRAESKSMVALLAGALAKAKGSIRLDPARANKDESKAGLPERPWSWHPKGGIKSSFKGQGHRPSDGTHTVANKTRDAVCASEAGSDGGASECLSGRRQRGGEMLKDRNEQALKRPGEEGKTRPMFSARRYRKVGEREAGALAGCNEGKRADGNAMGRRDDEVVHKDVQSLQKDLAQTRVGSGAKAVASLEGDRRQASSQRSESEEGRATRTCPRGRASTASTASTESTSHAASGSPTSAVSGASSPEGDAGWVRAVQQQELEQQGQVLSIEERISSCNPPPACRHVEIVCDKDGRARGERDKGDAANCGEEEEEEEEEEEAHASLEALDSPKSKRGRGVIVRRCVICSPVRLGGDVQSRHHMAEETCCTSCLACDIACRHASPASQCCSVIAHPYTCHSYTCHALRIKESFFHTYNWNQARWCEGRRRRAFTWGSAPTPRSS
jgi:hypothetical protein